jgi:trimeric autotransporter adhesin
MKKCLSVILLILSLSGMLHAAPLTGPKSIPGDYATLAAAIADLNVNGVGTGGVTFNIAANYSETFVTPTDGTITTTTGSITNPIVFQKSGSGANPLITAAPGVSLTADAIIAIGGCDYVTFDGIDLQENVLNLTPTTQMEWGYAICVLSATDGSQNITIKNCTISLTKTYILTKGIYSNHHTTAATTPLPASAFSGTNSNLKIYGNTINNCYSGIYLAGTQDGIYPYYNFDQNNEIGKDGTNTITNVAGQATTAGYGIYTIYQNNLKVANNNVTSNMGGTGAPSGIYIYTANNANVDVYNNYVSMTYSSTGAFNGIYVNTGGSGINNTANFYNNTVANCSLPAYTSGTCQLMYLKADVITASFHGNKVINNMIGNGTTTVNGTITYLSCQANPSMYSIGTMEVYNDTVTGNVRNTSGTPTGDSYFFRTGGNGSLKHIYNNFIDNNTIGNTGTGYGMYIADDQCTKYIYNNTVSNILGGKATVYGMYCTLGFTAYIYHNTFRNLNSSTVSTSIQVVGLYNATPAAYVYNNFISELKAPTSANVNGVVGIYISTNTQTYAGIYYNSVYLDAVSSGANFGSSALYLQPGSSCPVNLKNNIFDNNSTPVGTGSSVALRCSSATWWGNYYSGNYNDFYAGTPGLHNLIFYDGTNSDQTLAAFKTRMTGREAQSVTENPPFVNVGVAPYNLHLSTTTATQCESGGIPVSTPVAITTDFDNENRFPNAGYPVSGSFSPNAPDIGADEFGGLPSDQTGPEITLTPFKNTNSGDLRTLVVTITDGSGVPTAGNGRPVLYWKINSNSWQSVSGTWTGGSNYSFSFGQGVVFGDVVSYYIVAQDNSPQNNTVASPSAGASGFTTNPPACSTPPSSPYTYSIIAGISGTFHIGVGKDYTRLMDAVADLNSKYISGPVTFLLDDAFYSNDLFPIIINANPGSSPSNTVTIRPNTGVTAIFSGNSTSGMLNLAGIDYLTIDGSNSGGTDKSLTFQNLNLAGGAYGIYITTFGTNDPATNNTIKNCIIKSVYTQSYNTIAINFNSSWGGYDNNLITNNIITGGQKGIMIYGLAAVKTNNLQITNNVIGSVNTTEAIAYVGIQATYTSHLLISGNEIMGSTDGVVLPGIAGILVSTGCTDTRILKNKIHDWWHVPDDTYGACGIYYTSDASSLTEISDNLIYNIKAPGQNTGASGSNPAGIIIWFGGNIRIHHNTINLSGNFLTTTGAAAATCINIPKINTPLMDVRDNILYNSVQDANGNPLNAGDRTFGIQSGAMPDAYTYLDNNDYYITGINPRVGFDANNFVEYATLPLWQAYTGKEVHGQAIDPGFVATDMHPTNPSFYKLGVYLPTVPTDIDGTTHTDPPDMGAYQVSVNQDVNTLPATSVTEVTADLNGRSSPNGNTVNLSFQYGLTTSYGNTVAATPGTISGSNPSVFTASLTGLIPGTVYHFRAVGTSGSSVIYGSDETFTTIAGKILSLKVFMEGLYSLGTGMMNKAQECTDGAVTFDKFPGTIVDTLSIYLANPTDPWAFVYKSFGNAVQTDGTISVSIPNTYSGNYYIAIKQRSGVETWSAAPVSFSGGTISYDFTTAASQAFGSNQKKLEPESSIYGIFSGDVVSSTGGQDGYIDIFDNNDIFNKAQLGAYGYIPEDLTGDAFIDIFDMAIVFNNMQQSVGMNTPPNPSKK